VSLPARPGLSAAQDVGSLISGHAADRPIADTTGAPSDCLTPQSWPSIPPISYVPLPRMYSVGNGSLELDWPTGLDLPMARSASFQCPLSEHRTIRNSTGTMPSTHGQIRRFLRLAGGAGGGAVCHSSPSQ
jgi:hypothetical protein